MTKSLLYKPFDITQSRGFLLLEFTILLHKEL